MNRRRVHRGNDFPASGDRVSPGRLLGDRAARRWLSPFTEGPRERSGQGATLDQVRRQLFQKIDLPRAATDINYRLNLWASFFDFRITEKDAAQWVRGQGWKVRPVTEDDPAGFILVDGEARDTVVTDGFRFDSGEKIRQFGVFDRNAGRMSLTDSDALDTSGGLPSCADPIARIVNLGDPF